MHITLDLFIKLEPYSSEKTLEVIKEQSLIAKKKYDDWTNKYILDDNYWPSSTKSNSKQGEKQIRKQSKNLLKRIPLEWFNDIECGLPTYYFILSVKPETPNHLLEQNIELKLTHSSFDAELIIYAYEVLNDPPMKTLYNQFLRLTKLYLNTIDHSKRKKIEATHSQYVKKEKEYMLFAYLIREHLGWHLMNLVGFPSLYNLIGFKRKPTREEILKKYSPFLTRKNNNHLIKVLCEILLTPQLQKEYSLMNSFKEKYLKEDVKRTIKKRQKIWKKWGFAMEDIINNFLYPNDLQENIQNWEEYFFENIDWHEFLPPHCINFYTLLGLSPDFATDNPKGFRGRLFAHYKSSKRTAEINLAYSILKNPSSKMIYDWLLSNEFYSKLYVILTLEDIDLDHLFQEKLKLLEVISRVELSRDHLETHIYHIFS